MSEVVLINITGRDRLGLTARLTGVLAEYDIPVLDIDQSVTHNSLALAGSGGQ
ncbi:ACT domain-containing protein [Thiohalophilus sp.]|uniref:ACT domain-containing protein n=1 Tax=Thiohalophilus sp. TaxID=3028392 RepID=UPI002ACE4D41|nr:ACT domain-containing protein [Thiohalophilus sp.]MDZ7802754.1 ACT domain-containing protein [Thiohalophilus sp.]